ncbi:hypothetical protein BAE44_0004882, partial [Dichanthelium oligosanthes]
LGVDTTAVTVRRLWELSRAAGIPEQHSSVFTFLCCWQLWKHRNGVVFQSETPCLERILITCKEVAPVWAARLRPAERYVVDSWCNHLSQMKNLSREQTDVKPSPHAVLWAIQGHKMEMKIQVGSLSPVDLQKKEVLCSVNSVLLRVYLSRTLTSANGWC